MDNLPTFLISINGYYCFFFKSNKPNPNNEESGTIKIRPFLMEFLAKIKEYYELVVFTAATQEYADPIINALETNEKFFYSGRLNF